MSVAANLFESAIDQAFQGNVNYPSDTIKMALLTPSATPSLSSWVLYSDVTNEVAAGSGYTTGGVALASKTHVTTAANSWSTSWASTHGQIVGDIVIPATPNGQLYVCVVAGTTGSAASVLNGATAVQGNTVTDGTVTWSCLGGAITVWSSAAVQWTTATFSAAYGVIYDATSGALIALENFGQTLSPVAGTLTVTPNANGWWITTPA